MVVLVERTVYVEHESETSAKYKSRIRSLISNLKDRLNPQLKQDILDGNLKPAEFALMSTEVS